MNTMMFLNLCGFFVFVFATLQFVDASFYCHECEGDLCSCTSYEVDLPTTGHKDKNDPSSRRWRVTCTYQNIASGIREVVEKHAKEFSDQQSKHSKEQCKADGEKPDAYRLQYEQERDLTKKLENEVKHLNGELTTCISEKDKLLTEHAEKKVEKHTKEFSDQQSKHSKEQCKADGEKPDAYRLQYEQERDLTKKLENEVKHLNGELTTCISEKDKLLKEHAEKKAVDVESELFDEQKKSYRLEKKVEQLDGRLATCNSEKDKLVKERAEMMENKAKFYNDTKSKFAEEQRKAWDEVEREAQRLKDRERNLNSEKYTADIKLAECDKERSLWKTEKTECDSLRSSLETAEEHVTRLKTYLFFAIAIPLLGLAILFLVGYCCYKLYQTRAFKLEANFNRKNEKKKSESS